MGLAIGVGMLVEFGQEEPEKAAQMRADLLQINTHLSTHGLPPHQEPESFEEPLQSRATLNAFPYSWLHYLRRFAAHVMRDPKWVPYPVEPGEDPAADVVLRQMYRQMASHLLCHSDSEGYYVPLDFEPVLLDPNFKIRGGALGSSYRLREELVEIAEALEITFDANGEIDEKTAVWLSEQRPTGPPFAIERLVWFSLYEAARLSIAHKTAIVFY